MILEDRTPPRNFKILDLKILVIFQKFKNNKILNARGRGFV